MEGVYSPVGPFEVCNDVVALRHSLDVIRWIDEHRDSRLAAHLFDLRTLVSERGDVMTLVPDIQFLEFFFHLGTVRASGEAV